MIPSIDINDYNYVLPDDRIAKYPLPQRDQSKLLRYSSGKVEEYHFHDLPSFLPAGSLMVFNDTKVVPARLHFVRKTGAHIEIFCLQPEIPGEYNLSFATTEECVWKCVIGNAKRWKEDTLDLYNPEENETVKAMDMHAELLQREGETGLVRFTWSDGSAFSRVLEVCGSVPIPPYLNRDTEEVDKERYQTLYARIRGSVAAPTAGLHFTQGVIDAIKARGIETQRVCLHVGAGTFLPVKDADVSRHPMHREPFVVKRELLEKLLDMDRTVIAVGTTSVRTLESLYYAGVDCIEKGAPSDIGQWAPYERDYSASTREALEALIKYLDDNGLQELSLGTRIIIVPGFRWRIVDLLVTNFHQPCSTLLLLVSAFVGGDWQTIYRYAVTHGFRFLSYGDSSLLERVDK